MTSAATHANTATELRTAASIRRDIAAMPKGSSYRKGAIDAHRDCIRTARYCIAYGRLIEGCAA